MTVLLQNVLAKQYKAVLLKYAFDQIIFHSCLLFLKIQICTFPSAVLFIPVYIIVVGYYSFKLVIPVSICLLYVSPSVFHFQMMNQVNINRCLPNLICALTLWRSGL